MSGSSNSVQSPVEAVRRYLESLPQDVPVREELCSFRFWKAVRTEFLASLLLVLFGSSPTVLWSSSSLGGQQQSTPSPPREPAESSSLSTADELKWALALGLTAATLVQCVGNVSGANFNPAVSVALLVSRHISPLRALLYVAAQCCGATAGAGVLYGLTPKDLLAVDDDGGGAGHQPTTMMVTRVHPLVQPGQAFGVEFMSTLLVVVTVLANLDPRRVDTGYKALSIGLAYTVGHLFGFRSTGASMNPARSLGPAIVMNSWHQHWVYWVGPILGGIIGGFTREYTHDSSVERQFLRRSFRGRRHRQQHQTEVEPPPPSQLKRDDSGNSGVALVPSCSQQETELTTTGATSNHHHDCRV